MKVVLATLCLLALEAHARGAIKHPAVEWKAQTNTFAPAYSDEGKQLYPAGVAGVVLGFLAYGGFVIYSLVMLYKDYIQRNKDYEHDVQVQIDILKSEYGCSEKDIDDLKVEFQKERKGGNKKKEDEAIGIVN